jgi:hypothetical protein
MSAQNGTPMILPTRCDYRAKWMGFTRRLGSSVTLDELAPKLLDAVVETLGAAGAVLYLSNVGDGGLRAAAAVGTGCPAPMLADDDHARSHRSWPDGRPSCSRTDRPPRGAG